jgi:hypothetical protein
MRYLHDAEGAGLAVRRATSFLTEKVVELELEEARQLQQERVFRLCHEVPQSSQAMFTQRQHWQQDTHHKSAMTKSKDRFIF